MAASHLLIKAGAEVIVSDMKSREQLSEEVLALEQFGVKLQSGRQFLPENTGLVLRSPGVPRSNPAVQEAMAHRVPIVSEIELGSWFCEPDIIAVTGTDGKSSVVTMIDEALNDTGFRSVRAGNIGIPLCEVVQNNCARRYDFVVLEVSSYALENIHHFQPKIAMILNIAEDHLDHYDSFDHYTEVKGRISAKQTEQDFLILNANDERCMRFAEKAKSRTAFFALDNHGREGAFFSGETVICRLGNEEQATHVNLHNWFRHQKENFAASMVAMKLAGCDIKKAAGALNKFRGLPHRIEFVRELDGVAYFDDSKATTAHATTAALKSIDKPVVLIAGGDAKGADFTGLRPLIGQKVKAMVLLGMSKEQLAGTFSDIVPCHQVDSIEEAVRKARELSEPGDIVLLSPACSSLDMFRNFEQRGTKFQEAVAQL